jgi:glycosyltransferase involved in cell wall biosynthesis
MDAHLAECNAAADHTVFVSNWLREYHAQHWFDVRRPHSVITNGADPAIFHPLGTTGWTHGTPLRICTHHWSDNPAKGFAMYEELDQLIASGKVPGVEFWVIGRWPSHIRWQATRTFEPCSGKKLADLLRSCHVCFSASKYEPGAMHPVEALACGLPLLYTSDTGGTVELGEKFGIRVAEQGLQTAIEELQSHYDALRMRVLQEAPSGDQMCLAYRRLVQTLICQR